MKALGALLLAVACAAPDRQQVPAATPRATPLQPEQRVPASERPPPPIPEQETSSLPVDCGEAFLLRHELEATLGDKHPKMIQLADVLAKCASPIEIDPALCVKRRQNLEQLRGRGLGPRHPDVAATKRSLEACEAAVTKRPTD